MVACVQERVRPGQVRTGYDRTWEAKALGPDQYRRSCMSRSLRFLRQEILEVHLLLILLRWQRQEYPMLLNGELPCTILEILFHRKHCQPSRSFMDASTPTSLNADIRNLGVSLLGGVGLDSE